MKPENQLVPKKAKLPMSAESLNIIRLLFSKNVREREEWTHLVIYYASAVPYFYTCGIRLDVSEMIEFVGLF